MTAIYELKQILIVNTPFGEAQVLFIMDYGIHNNSIWVCASNSDGKIRHFDTNQITIKTNHTLNFNINQNTP
jgi:hypothetical protein